MTPGLLRREQMGLSSDRPAREALEGDPEEVQKGGFGEGDFWRGNGGSLC